MELSKTYPKSKYGKKCLGPCYAPKHVIMHPITLDYVTQKTPFCPVVPQKDKKGREIQVDECIKISEYDDSYLHIITPQIEFVPEYFLKEYYGIVGLDETYEYIKSQPKLPLPTIERLINCAWKAFGLKRTLISEIVVKAHMDYIEKIWIDDISIKISTKTSIEKSKVKQYIIEKLLVRDIFHHFFSYYTKKYNEKWKYYQHNVTLKNEITKYFTKLIAKAL
jgi:hypothetical protein